MPHCGTCYGWFERGRLAHDLDPDICPDCEDKEIDRHLEACEWRKFHANDTPDKEG